MPDNLIRDQVRAKQPSSGIGSNFNLDNLESSKRSVGSMADSANRVLGVQEKRKRAEAEEMAAADMVEFSAYMSEMKTGYDIALSQTVDPEEIKTLSEEYEAESREYVDGDQLRQQISKDRANEYLTKNSPNLFKNAAELRVTAVNEAESIAKLEIGVAQVKKNPLTDNKIFKGQLKAIYSELVSMGKMTPTQAKQKIDVDMEQKKRDEAIFVTAGFQTQMNDLTQAANTEAANLAIVAGETKGIISEKELSLINEVFDGKSKELIAGYKQEIIDLQLTPPEERKLLSALDADQNYRSKFLKSIRGQVDQEQARIQGDNVIKFQYGNGDRPLSYADLKKWNLPQTFEKQYMARQLSLQATAVKGAADFKAEQEAKVKGLYTHLDITRALQKMTPDSNKREYLDLIEAATTQPNQTLVRESLNEIENKRDPDKYYSDINQAIEQFNKDIDLQDEDKKSAWSTLELKQPDDTEFPDMEKAFTWKGLSQQMKWNWEVITPEAAATELERKTIRDNIDKRAREISATKGIEAAKVFLNEEKVKIFTKEAANTYMQEMLELKFTAPVKEPYKNPLTGRTKTGVPHDIGSNKEFKIFRKEIDGILWEFDPLTKEKYKVK